MWGVSEQLSTSQEGLCCMELSLMKGWANDRQQLLKNMTGR